MSNKLLILVIAVLSASCAKKDGLRVALVNNNLSAASQAMGNQLMVELEKSTGEGFLHASEDDADVTITITARDLGTNMAGQAMIQGNGFSCSMAIDDDYLIGGVYVQDYFVIIFLHELGHCFGLEHTGDPTDIMYPYLQPGYQGTTASYKRFVEQLTFIRDRDNFYDSKFSSLNPKPTAHKENHQWNNQPSL